MSNFPATAAVSAPGNSPEGRVRRGAKALVSSSSRVLLVEERHTDGRAFWTLPGGGVRPRETLTEGLRRELREELRCESVVSDPTAAFWYAHQSPLASVSHYTVFPCTLVSGAQPVRSEGILDSAWVDPAEPPAGTLPQVRSLLAEHGAGP